LLAPPMKQKRLAWANKYRSWTTDDWMKVAFRASVVRRKQWWTSESGTSSADCKIPPPPPQKKVLGLFHCKWSWESSSSWWHDEFVKVHWNP
jgi:hypothetical protein